MTASNLKFIGNMLTDNGKFLDAASIEPLINAGLSAAVFDISGGESEIEHSRAEVLTAFVKLNSPVALILRTPATDLSQAALLANRLKFNYIWIEDEVDPQAILLLPPMPDVKIIASIKDMSGIEGLLPLCAGFFLANDFVSYKKYGEQLPILSKQIFVKESLNPPAFVDAVVFERPEAQLFKKLTESISNTDYISGIEQNQYLMSRLSPRKPALKEDVIAYTTVLAAEKLSAKAIIAMTCEAGPIDRLTSYYPKMPVIAAANRKLYEGLLLSFCCNYGVLPTAITKIPEKPGEEIEFARFIAGLYGYQPGDTFVVTGSYHPCGPKHYMEIITL